jgi:hypothetical protein
MPVPHPVRPVTTTGKLNWKQVLFHGAKFTYNDTSYHKSSPKGQPWSLGYHTGTDISQGISRGTPVHAPVKGTVVKAGFNVEGSAYGNAVLIKMDDGYYMLFAHLDSVAGIRAGDKIPAGAFIGRVGDTGAKGQVHLHLEVRTPKSGGKFGAGNFVNPIDYLNGKKVKAPVVATGGGSAAKTGGGSKTTTTTTTSSGGGGIKGVAGFTKADYLKWLDAKFGSIKILREMDAKARKELGGQSIDWLVDQLAAKKITDVDIVATYMNQTGWFKKYGAEASLRLVAERQRPGFFASEVAARKADVKAQANALGFNLSDKALGQLARDTYVFGWSMAEALDEAQKSYMATGDVTYDGGTIGESQDALEEAAFMLGVQLTSADIKAMRQDVIDGKGYQSQLDDLRERSANTYTPFAEQIRAGQSLRQVAGEYFQKASDLLELGSPDDIDMNDPLFAGGKAFMTADPNTGKMMQKGLWDFEKEVRKDQRWLKTQNAHDSTYETANNLLSLMGLM